MPDSPEDFISGRNSRARQKQANNGERRGVVEALRAAGYGVEKVRNRGQARKETGSGTRSFPRTGLTGQKTPSWFLARVYLISALARIVRFYGRTIKARTHSRILTASEREKVRENEETGVGSGGRNALR